MRLVRSVVLVLSPCFAAAMFAGCAPAPAPAPPPPVVSATPQQAMETQSDFQRYDPRARVGHVASVNTAMSMCAVVGIPYADVHHDDTLVFTDSKQNPIASGTIYRAGENPEYQILTVDYSISPGGRAPMKGDLAIYIPSAAAAPTTAPAR